MFKRFKGKIIAALLCAVMLAGTLPLGVQAVTPAFIPAFTMVRADQTSIAAGQSITLMLRTINADSVIVTANGTTMAATQGELLATGELSWSLTFTPNNTQIIAIHASHANIPPGRVPAEAAFPVTVAGQQQTQTPTPQQPTTPAGQHSIHSVEEIQATARNSVTLRIVTDTGVNYVWVGPLGPNQYARGERQSSEGGTTVWHVTYRPPGNARHSVTVGANASFVLDNRMASQAFEVQLSAPYVPAQVVRPADAGISRVSAGSDSVRAGEQTRLTVRTGRDIQYVWAIVDGRRVNARREGITSWSMNVRPDRTQTISVFANTENSESGAVTDTIRITVNEASNPRVTDVRADQMTGLSMLQSVTLQVTTNRDAEYVWATIAGQTFRGTRVETRNNEVRWEIRSVWLAEIGNNVVWVYANTENRLTDSAHRQSITLGVVH